MILDVMYRGPLMSCNYDCWYCPFAKMEDDAQRQHDDRIALDNFTRWLEQLKQKEHFQLRIFFTPWGEALTRTWYRDALTRISHMPHVRSISIQSNGAWPFEWLHTANKKTLRFWLTYHPSQIKRSIFVERCHKLRNMGFTFSVGSVGISDAIDDLELLRNELHHDIPMWVNAYHDGGIHYYTETEIQRLTTIDPHFTHNLNKHSSQGKKCRAGQTAISINGAGEIRRCHFVDEVIGNINNNEWESALQERTCPNTFCNCYIGYAHLEQPTMDEIYGDDIWSRIPINH